jgi:hypothetical protein
MQVRGAKGFAQHSLLRLTASSDALAAHAKQTCLSADRAFPRVKAKKRKYLSLQQSFAGKTAEAATTAVGAGKFSEI